MNYRPLITFFFMSLTAFHSMESYGEERNKPLPNTVSHRETFALREDGKYSRGRAGSIVRGEAPVKWVICMDGTANEPDSQTNVVWIYQMLSGMSGGSPRKDVIGYYDSGVGTTRSQGLTGKIFGAGFGKNVQQAAWTLGRYYRPGDHIYIFGFSRGALQALELVGFLRLCGVVLGDSDQTKEDVSYLFEKVYRTTDDCKACDGSFGGQLKSPPQEPRLSEEAKRLLAEFDARSGKKRIHPSIDYLGLWDPVDAMGWRAPGLLSLTYEALESNVRKHGVTRNIWLDSEESRGRLALSLDERRGVYFPVIPAGDKRKPTHLEVAWFAGDHCDCGGGHGPTDSSIKKDASRWPLQWRFNDGDHLANISFNWVVSPVAAEIFPPDLQWKLREPSMTRQNPGKRHDTISHFLFKSAAARIRKEMYVDQQLEGMLQPVTGLRAGIWPRNVHESVLRRMSLNGINPAMEPDEIWEYSLLRRQDNDQPLEWTKGREGGFRPTLSILAFAPRKMIHAQKEEARYVPVPFRQLAWPSEKIPAALEKAGLRTAR